MTLVLSRISLSICGRTRMWHMAQKSPVTGDRAVPPFFWTDGLVELELLAGDAGERGPRRSLFRAAKRASVSFIFSSRTSFSFLRTSSSCALLVEGGLDLLLDVVGGQHLGDDGLLEGVDLVLGLLDLVEEGRCIPCWS